MRNFIIKYKSIIAYLFFGVCTTLVNIISYWCLTYLCGMDILPGNIAAWFLSVLFAFYTNRKWVFFTKVRGIKPVFMEMISFISGRLATGIIDWGLMFVFADLLALNDMLVKIAVNVLVIILNYLVSKFLVFRNRK